MKVAVALLAALVAVAAVDLDGVAMLETHVAEVAALVQVVAPAARSVLEKRTGNYWTQLHSDLLQVLPQSPGAEQPLLPDVVLVLSRQRTSDAAVQHL